MEVIIDVILHKEDIEGDKGSVESVRAESKDEVVKALEPLLQKGWKVYLTSTRINF